MLKQQTSPQQASCAGGPLYDKLQLEHSQIMCTFLAVGALLHSLPQLSAAAQLHHQVNLLAVFICAIQINHIQGSACRQARFWDS